MQNDWAAENLQTIRTLMERSALYRRALGPLMTAVGVTGLLTAAVGLKIQSTRGFAGLWILAGIVGLIESFLLARRQALKDGEEFWSVPTRRIVTAVLPAFIAGF